jgi:hypothetical protein
VHSDRKIRTSAIGGAAAGTFVGCLVARRRHGGRSGSPAIDPSRGAGLPATGLANANRALIAFDNLQ